MVLCWCWVVVGLHYCCSWQNVLQPQLVEYPHWKKNRSICLNKWVLQVSPERIICIRQVDSLNVMLSQVHPLLKNFLKTIIMHELYILNENISYTTYIFWSYSNQKVIFWFIILFLIGSNLTSDICFLLKFTSLFLIHTTLLLQDICLLCCFVCSERLSVLL